MEYHKMCKLLNDSTVSKFVIKMWIEVNDSSGSQYSAKKYIRFKTPMQNQICVTSDAHIAVKGRINVTGSNNANRRNKNLTFKNNVSFISCITKINNTFIEDLNAEGSSHTNV